MKLLIKIVLLTLLFTGCKESAMPLHTRYAGHYAACKPVTSLTKADPFKRLVSRLYLSDTNRSARTGSLQSNTGL